MAETPRPGPSNARPRRGRFLAGALGLAVAAALGVAAGGRTAPPPPRPVFGYPGDAEFGGSVTVTGGVKTEGVDVGKELKALRSELRDANAALEKYREADAKQHAEMSKSWQAAIANARIEVKRVDVNWTAVNLKKPEAPEKPETVDVEMDRKHTSYEAFVGSIDLKVDDNSVEMHRVVARAKSLGPIPDEKNRVMVRVEYSLIVRHYNAAQLKGKMSLVVIGY